MIEAVISIVLLAALITAGILIYGPKKSVDKISFKETLDLTDLPIITFKHKDLKLNFLLDTGATESIINSNVLDYCDYRELQELRNLSGLDGIQRQTNMVKMELSYNSTVYPEDFISTDMSETFGQIKAETGVNLHGILGSNFFQKYKYIIDFDKLVAYSKK